MKALKRISELLFIGVFSTHVAPAQKLPTVSQDTAYVHAVEQALTHLQKGDCQLCLDSYKKAFQISQNSALSTMRAALCAYRCGREDLARTYIDQAITVDYGIAEDIWFDRQIAPEFDAVRSTNMATYVREAFARKDAALKLNIPLKNELQAIYETDQQPRAQIDSLIQKYGNESAQMQQLWQHIHRTDSINLIRIESIIRQYGYPGKRLVGPNQSNTAWLIIQHSPLATQEKYLPLIRKAAEEGEMDKSNVALLVDRIRMYKGQKQLYGSQIAIDPSGKRHFHPIADEVNVNKRRADMDLGSIEDYARENDILYKPVGRKSKK